MTRSGLDIMWGIWDLSGLRHDHGTSILGSWNMWLGFMCFYWRIGGLFRVKWCLFFGIPYGIGLTNWYYLRFWARASDFKWLNEILNWYSALKGQIIFMQYNLNSDSEKLFGCLMTVLWHFLASAPGLCPHRLSSCTFSSDSRKNVKTMLTSDSPQSHWGLRKLLKAAWRHSDNKNAYQRARSADTDLRRWWELFNDISLRADFRDTICLHDKEPGIQPVYIALLVNLEHQDLWVCCCESHWTVACVMWCLLIVLL